MSTGPNFAKLSVLEELQLYTIDHSREAAVATKILSVLSTLLSFGDIRQMAYSKSSSARVSLDAGG